MGNRLYQEAQRFVQMASQAGPAEQQQTIVKAKNALHSAYANSTRAEQEQLRELQDQLDQLAGR
ncbi:DUF3813 domain-containing protein [Bacillus infantis]|uniref:DUF3813 domain-containing protein n=1 Tax=Bacillus infantis TaxID=324767 RepID=UPI003CE87341